MAVLTVEIFAHAPEDTDPDTFPPDAFIETTLRDAIAPLTGTPESALPVLTCAITPYGGAAMVEALCVGPSGEEATDVIAARLEAAMQDTPDAFEGWHLHAGCTHVHMSDN
ncbi:hypothetical protein CLV63_12452 [Murinocardiopsis flavida]|uniref:Uncharacterized protein n=1 Tax=Murinocardiopsis flavida TaxID=645275 RepID=A0A2P8CYA1_9ACTN|nr:hypothetical protein [Murinocardiopsis flavida]PSK89948.1 hypothetical protein CLV63_12452 [Murinocardiopsis flavida]